MDMPHFETYDCRESAADVFDRVVRLDAVPDGYRAMDTREAIKVMVDSEGRLSRLLDRSRCC